MDARLRTAPQRCSFRPMTATAHVTGFDTLSYARRLKAAGVDEAQAEAHAEAVRDAVAEGVATKADLDTGLAAVKADVVRVEDRMATKADLAEVKAELKADVAEVKADVARLEGRVEHIEDKMATKTDVANLETRLTVRFVGIAVGIVLANAGLTFGLLKLLPSAAG